MQIDNTKPAGPLRRRLATIGIASALCIASSAPMAAIVDSGPVNLAVPMTTAGLYLNLVTGVSNPSPGAVPGWDFNPYGGTTLSFFSPSGVTAYVGSGTVATALVPGNTIGPANTYVGNAGTLGTAFRTTGTEYVGMRFTNEATATVNYGYALIQTTGPNGIPATILRYVYENTGLPITINGGGPTIIYAYNFANNHLVSFDATAPGTLLTDVALTGLAGGEFLLGIDFRPANGLLYAIATKGVAGTVGGDHLVTVNTATGAVTSVDAANTLTTPAGVFFGLDFNPVPDRFREVSDSEVDLRLNPNNGTLAGTDTPLAYVAADPNFGVDPNVVHVAYSNNTAGALTSTLYGIDTNTDSLVMIGGVDGVPSPNTGQLTTIGPLGVGALAFGGFDIHFGTNVAYAALRVGGVSSLYTINLTTGAATLVGAIGSGTNIDGLSVAFAPGSVPTALVSAVSRRTHGAAGTFDLPLSLIPPPSINHNPTTEPRQGPAQTIVMTFSNPLTGASASITEGSAAVGGFISGNDAVVNLTGVVDQQYVTLSLTGISDAYGGTGGSASVRIGFLLGDVNQNRVVAVSDVGLVNAQLAQPVSATNYLKDVNASGTLTVGDKGITNANLAHSLPAP